MRRWTFALALAAGIAVTLTAAAGAVSPGDITEFPVTGGSGLTGITEADGSLWFTDGASIGRIAPSGNITAFPGPTPSGHATDWNGITFGSDGDLWVTGSVVGGGGVIAKVSTSGTFLNLYSVNLQEHSDPTIITPGPSGSGTLWFIDNAVPDGGSDDVGEITTGGTISEYDDAVPPDPDGIVAADGDLYLSAPATDDSYGTIDIVNPATGDVENDLSPGSMDPGFDPGSLTADGHGNVWFTLDNGANIFSGQDRAIGELQVKPSDTVTAYSAGLQAGNESEPMQIAAGPNGDMYFVDWGFQNGGKAAIGQITPTGAITEFTTGLSQGGGTGTHSVPVAITAGPDGNIWFTDHGTQSIGRLDLVASSPPPPPRSPSPPGLVVPKLSHVRQSHKTWLERGKKHKHGPPVGTTFSFTLNEAANVKLTFTGELAGRKVRHACVARTHHNRHNPKCTHPGPSSSVTQSAIAGANSVQFTGRTSAPSRLRPGNYKLVITASADGSSTHAPPLRFTIDAAAK